MKPNWHLILNLIAWAAAFPAIGVITSILKRTIYPTIVTDSLPVPIAWTLMIAWAIWIYWKYIPRAENSTRRIIYFLAFAALIFAVGFFSLSLGIILVTLLFGV